MAAAASVSLINKHNENMQISLKSEFISTDVTAVKIIKDKVLAGIGSFLHIFDLSSSVCEVRKEVFIGQKIHGFCYKDNKLLIYGGRYFLVLLYSTIKTVQIPEPWLSLDWILTAHWLQDTTVALALAHNVVTVWDTTKGHLLSKTTCEEKCILYSALLLGDSWSELVVFGGTAFSEVVIWSPSSVANPTEDRPVWHRLTGHKGVIFSISYNENLRCLLTSSDDRSVRVWKVVGDAGWQSADIKVSIVVFGHISRVWRVLSSPVGFISIGEDSILCQWDDTGQLVSKHNTHQGGSIWSVDIAGDLLVTGGGDGGISTWPLGPSPTAKPQSLLPWSEDWVRKVGLTARGRVVVTTEQGRLCWLDNELDVTVWQQLWQNDQFFSYALLELSPCRSRLALASIHGNVALFQETQENINYINTCQLASDKKILKLFWLTSDLLLTCQVGGILTLCDIVQGQEVTARSSWKEHCRGVSAAILVGDFLVLGDQVGSIYLHQATGDMALLHKLPRLVGSDGVTSLFMCPTTSQLAATGKDGRIHWIKICPEGRLIASSCQQTRLFWLLGLRQCELGTLALAVYKEVFQVWSLTQQRPLLQVNCGGGHRSWDFSLAEGRVQFVFVRERIVQLASSRWDFLVRPQIRGGLHSRLINCLLSLPCPSDCPALLVSGGDEGSVRVWFAETGRQVASLHAHLSSVRALCCHLHKDQLYLFSAGGRAQLMTWRISNVTSQGVSVDQLSNHLLCESEQRSRTPWADKHFKPRPNPETRYMSLCVLPSISGVCVLAACSDSMLRTFHLDTDTSVMSLLYAINHHTCCVLTVSQDSHFTVSTSCDGTLSVWDSSDFSPNDDGLVNEGKISERLVLPLWSGRVHQSGVNCVAMQRVSTTCTLLLSGGDDNKLAVNEVNTMENNSTVVKSVWNTNQAHATQITGLCWIDEDKFISTSIDQRVIVWQRDEHSDWKPATTALSTVADIHGLTVVSRDKSNCQVCVYGKGVEEFSLSCRCT